jgi:hypothetical protein
LSHISSNCQALELASNGRQNHSSKTAAALQELEAKTSARKQCIYRGCTKIKVMPQLRTDVAFLANHQIVDYSLFVARFDNASAPELAEKLYRATNGTVYRMAILDFFYTAKAK